MKKAMLTLVFLLTSFITFQAHAWPEVDHMNMCGSASKVVRTYGGQWQGWDQHDHYIAKRGSDYYLRTNCPDVKQPVGKSYKQLKTASKAKKAKSRKVSADKTKKVKRISKSLRGGYDKHADCLRVDELNSRGPSVRLLRKR